MLIDPDVQLTAEPEGYEYGYYAFDNIDPIETQIEINEITNRKDSKSPIKMPNEDIVLPIKNDKLMELQQNDKFCKHIISMLKSGKLHMLTIHTILKKMSSKGILKTINKDLRW